MSATLRDIQGLDPVSWWPIAPEVWLATGLLILALILIFLWARRLYRYPLGSWRNEARKALKRLQRNQHSQTAKQTVSELSELLRRIAMARFGRERLASLTGKHWLQWIEGSDPSGFNWTEKGEILISLPYAPEGITVDQPVLQELINAALHLAAKSREDAVTAKRGKRNV